ncbi:unnamed protein product, partial [Mesorhabditis spiculigera]
MVAPTQAPTKVHKFDHDNPEVIQTGPIGNLYLQYLLLSGLYMLEPWERKLFNASLIALIASLLYFTKGLVF